MFKAFSVFVLSLFLCLSAQAFNKDECQEIAENIYGAQTLLNQSPEAFAKATATIKATPAEQMDWSEAQKKAILGLAAKLKPGLDPVKVGQAVFESCKNTI